jgi:xanthine dehydrogenase/oxidase
MVKKQFDYDKKRKEVDDFNSKSRYKKRGIAITPLKFGIAFTFSTLNQGSAIVHLYRDGTVLISHGGTEMGQGINTKMAQIAATVLNIPISVIHIEETSTDKCANTSPTAASSGSDLNGHAVRDACMVLKGRLAPYIAKGLGFADAVTAAWSDRIDMSARGFYAMKEVKFDWETARGVPFQYYTYGACASEVEIDTLTGDHQILRSDLIYDTGDPLNTGIDIGQIEGGFLQGVGWLTIEEYLKGNEYNKWIPPGKIQTTGPGRYKIPSFNDIPIQFNVGFLPHSENHVGVYSSKAIGEPPFLLAQAVGFAIIDAIKAARKDSGESDHMTIEFPLTASRIRTLAATKIDKKQ